jgi:short-subunit dehydrogenase
MEGLALILATFGIAVSVLKPSPVRTAFLRNAGGLTHPAADDPYAAPLGSYNATMTGVHAAGQAPRTSPTSSRRSRAPPGPSCATSPRRRRA